MILLSDARKIPLADKSIDCCVTSPPYYGLRDYGNNNQIGLEPTLQGYIEQMVLVFREVWRVMKDEGTLWLNLGDGYCGGGRGGHVDRMTSKNWDPKYPPSKIPNGLKTKDLMGIPWRIAFALQDDGWYLRSDIIWSKPNPMPESVKDRPTRAHEYIFLLSKNKRYYYDNEAIKEPMKDVTYFRLTQPNFDNQTGGPKDPKTGNRSHRKTLNNQKEKLVKQEKWKTRQEGYEEWKKTNTGRNKRTVWTVTTKPYKGAHFATFPPDLIEPCILAGTSEKGVCPDCGKAWVRDIEKIDNGPRITRDNMIEEYPDRNTSGQMNTKDMKTIPRIYKGWNPQCECGLDPVPATVLDPFFGSGTTGQVAIKHRRKFVGLDISMDYIELAKKRTSNVDVLMF